MSDQYHTFKRIVKNHTDSSEYYQRCAQITTETDLVELFEALAKERIDMANSLLSLLTGEEKKGFWRIGETYSYLQKIWYNVKVALIVNDRTKLLAYCRKAEGDTLHEYEAIIQRQELSEDLFRYVVAHQQQLKDMISKIDKTPVKKCYLQKSLAA